MSQVPNPALGIKSLVSRVTRISYHTLNSYQWFIPQRETGPMHTRARAHVMSPSRNGLFYEMEEKKASLHR